MLIEEMMNKRDIATNLAVIFQNTLGTKDAGVFMIEDFEKRDNSEFREYVISEMERLNLNTMIFIGWIFTKELFSKVLSYFNFENESIDTKLVVISLPEVPGLIVCKDKETFKNNILKLSELQKKSTNLNISNIKESDNGVEFNYFTHTSVKYFEEKPKVIEKIISNENE